MTEDRWRWTVVNYSALILYLSLVVDRWPLADVNSNVAIYY